MSNTKLGFPVASVLLLAKPYPLSFHLERAIRDTGCRFQAIYERPRSIRRVAKSILRKHGVVKAADILAYSLYERVFRAKEIRAQMTAFPAAPSTDAVFFDSANNSTARKHIAEFGPDIMVVHATGLLRPETFNLATVAVNLHVGVLPKYRGHDSTFWALRNGDVRNVGATLHVIDAGADTGQLISRAHVPLLPEDTDVTAWIRSFNAGVSLVTGFLERPFSTDILSITESGRHWPRRGLSDYLFGWRSDV